MNESDILEIIKLLKSAVSNNDWNDVDEAIGYLHEYVNDGQENEEY